MARDRPGEARLAFRFTVRDEGGSVPVIRKVSMLLVALSLVLAQALAAPPPDPTADPDMIAAGFLTAHPDLRYRLAGIEALDDAPQDAFGYFQRAAYYADKPSQGMVAEMYWEGRGVARDRALGYAWMDLAAERGYRTFVVHRERYWESLDEADRARAVAAGQGVYARYGDTVAQPRMDAVLRRARRQVTGSRTGMAGNLKIVIPGSLGNQTIDASRFYDPTYWDPDRYRQWHDATWMAPRRGRVTVGDVERAGSRVHEAPPPP